MSHQFEFVPFNYPSCISSSKAQLSEITQPSPVASSSRAQFVDESSPQSPTLCQSRTMALRESPGGTDRTPNRDIQVSSGSSQNGVANPPNNLYEIQDIEQLARIVKEVLPLAVEDWHKTAKLYNEWAAANRRTIRTHSALKKKWNALVKSAPTGCGGLSDQQKEWRRINDLCIEVNNAAVQIDNDEDDETHRGLDQMGLSTPSTNAVASKAAKNLESAFSHKNTAQERRPEPLTEPKRKRKRKSSPSDDTGIMQFLKVFSDSLAQSQKKWEDEVRLRKEENEIKRLELQLMLEQMKKKNEN